MYKNPLNNIIIITLACLLALGQLCSQYTSIFRPTQYTLRPAVSAGTITTELAEAMEVGNSRDSAKAHSAGNSDDRSTKIAKANLLRSKAGKAFRSKSHNEAIRFLKRVLEIDTELDNPKWIALDMRLIGANYLAVKLYKEAADYCERSAKLYDRFIKELDASGKRPYIIKRQKRLLREEKSRSWSLAAKAYSELSRTDEKAWYDAIRCLENCIRLNRVLHLKKMECKARTILGNAYMDVGKFKEASRQFESSARMEERLGDLTDAAKGYSQAAIAHEHHAEKHNNLPSYGKAAALNKKSAELNATKGNANMAIRHYLYAAIDYDEVGDIDSADKCRQEAHRINRIVITGIWETRSQHSDAAADKARIKSRIMRGQSHASAEAQREYEAMLDDTLDQLAAINEVSRPHVSIEELVGGTAVTKLIATSA